MEERLKLFLSMEGISASQFAAKMNIQRSGLSHLLSGRNKPSYDFITRMLQEYPELNSEWLLLGIGKPYKNDLTKANEIANTVSQAPLSNYFEEQVQIDEDLPSLFSNINTETNDLDKNFQVSNYKKIRESIPLQEEPKQKDVVASSERTIKEIVILYSDGTYEVR